MYWKFIGVLGWNEVWNSLLICGRMEEFPSPWKQYTSHIVCLKFSFSLSDATHHLGNKPPGSINPYLTLIETSAPGYIHIQTLAVLFPFFFFPLTVPGTCLTQIIGKVNK